MDKIVGRTKEKTKLENIYNSKEAELVAIYGRRRIGKTFLIKNFYRSKPCIFFHITGIKNAKLSQQLQQFYKIIGETFYGGASISAANNWISAFEELTKAIKITPRNKKIVLFFDELPWLATKRSGLIQALDYFWNRYWIDMKNIKLIVCGSLASWIINKLIHDKGGLHNRITDKIILKPFNLKETRHFLNNYGIKLNENQILEIYMAFGGIPYYLKQIKKGATATQNINKICFNKEGILFSEFDEVFSSLFDESEAYKELIILISNSREGMSREQIEKQNKLTGKGGRLSKRLSDLEVAGFINSFIPLGHEKRGVYYRLFDEYCHFYLTWIKAAKRTLMKEETDTNYWQMKASTQKYKNWSGYAFESICYKHITNIRKALGIDYNAEVGSWRYTPKKRNNQNGTQIDLLFDRADGAVTICEIKNTEQPFIIDKAYYNNLLNKADVYKRETRTKKQIFFAMISANGIKTTMYSEKLIANVVTLDDLFND